jgi:hypothetical protein
MELLDEPLEKARQKIIGFRITYGIAWEDFQKLENFQDKYRGLTARRWVEVVKGDVRPHGTKRQLTLDLADLIDEAPATILAIVPHRHSDRSVVVLQQPGSRETRNAWESETLANEMIVRAGNGMPKSSIETLTEACEHDLPYHPDEAMAPLQALIYLSSRYLKPQQFMRNVDRILPKLGEKRKLHSVHPVLRGRVIAQIASYMQDRGNVEAGLRHLHHPKAKAILESSWVTEPVKCHMHRQLAMAEAYLSKRFDRARACIKDITATGDAESVRSSAIAMSSLWRMQGRFDKANASIEEELYTSLKILSTAATEQRLATGSLVHHFCCILRGCVARFVHEARKGGNPDMENEIHVMNWILDRVGSFPLETPEFQPLPGDVRLPPDLELIRNRCHVPKLDAFQLQRLDDLVQALDT